MKRNDKITRLGHFDKRPREQFPAPRIQLDSNHDRPSTAGVSGGSILRRSVVSGHLHQPLLRRSVSWSKWQTASFLALLLLLLLSLTLLVDGKCYDASRKTTVFYSRLISTVAFSGWTPPQL
ncbi:uncharacterized protein G2W53_008618 [Senna tora]|uniref:Uncharacterized protein n=1 Tax=Senna tora TaxID=362788 RepID=A0A835CFZ5_9FABA|nr:uncharacterized protein G2W53_008618 [Senna tora]